MRNDAHRPSTSVALAAPWREVVFVCGKCMKRQDRELRSELKQALRRRGIRDVRVVACGCLDLCPDDGIALILGADLADASRRLRVVGRKESVDDLAAMAADGAGATRPHRS